MCRGSLNRLSPRRLLHDQLLGLIGGQVEGATGFGGGGADFEVGRARHDLVERGDLIVRQLVKSFDINSLRGRGVFG